MRCHQARALLPALLDQGLTARVEARVRAHAEHCARCSDTLAEHRAAEALLRRLPELLLPLEPTPESEFRLAGLARWAAVSTPLWPGRLSASAVGAFAAAALLAVVLTIGDWSPVVEEPLTYRSYAWLAPEPSFAPTGWR